MNQEYSSRRAEMRSAFRPTSLHRFVAAGFGGVSPDSGPSGLHPGYLRSDMGT
jgi:hypothetical protein